MAKFDLKLTDVVPRSLRQSSRFTAEARATVKAKLKITKDPQKQILAALENTRILFESNITTKLIAALDDAMAASVWQAIGGTGDIVDSGALRNSLEVSATQGKITIRYEEDYAALVHYGGYITPYGNPSIEKVYIPPRPWVQSVLQGGGPVAPVDFPATYKEALYKFL